MFTIPLYIFLFIYFLFLAFFAVLSILNFYHVAVTASFTMASFIVSFFTFTLTILTIYFTWYLLQNIDWRMGVTLFSTDWLTDIFSNQQIGI